MTAAPRPWQHREHHPPADVRTWIDLLLHRAAVTPELVLYRHLVDGEVDEVRLTAGELSRRARALAVHLQTFFAPGARVLLPHPPGLDFAPALLACCLAGVVGVPVPAPETRRGPAHRRLVSICRDAGVTAVLTIPEVLAQSEFLIGDLKDVTWIDQTSVGLDHADDYTPPPVGPDTVAYLQYTSGSTAEPRGVEIRHSNLLHNCAALNEAYALTPASVMVYWVPTYHDLGLVYGVALPLFIGFTAVSLAPHSFIQRPIRWLRALSRHRGSHSVAPNFGYELAVTRTRPEERQGLDLSAWRHALSGGEPIRHAVERDFLATYAPFGLGPDALSHSYGMSEATAELTSEPPGARGVFLPVDPDALARGRVAVLPASDPRARMLAGCGVPAPDTEIEIVDPDTLTICPEGHVGEVWIRSPSVAPGYFNNSAATLRSFRARLAGDAREWLRSGDLGFFNHSNLFIAGRQKDLVILRGENHYPQDLEWAVQGHPALRPNSAVAFAHDDGARERLVLVSEVYPDRAGDPAPIFAAIRAALAGHGLQPATIALCPPGAVEKTASGKVQRALTRRAFADDKLIILARWDAPEAVDPDEEDLRDALADSDEATCVALLRDYLVRLAAARLGHTDGPHVRPPATSLPDDRATPDRAASPVSERNDSPVSARNDSPVSERTDPLSYDHDSLATSPLPALGLDSLATVELAERLTFQLGAPVAIAELTDGRSLAELARDLAPRRAVALPIAPGDRHAPFPLYGIQQAYWVGRAGGPMGGVSCHTYHEFDSEGLDIARLERAWNLLIKRHDALRLVFDERGSQRVLADVPRYTIAVDDLRRLGPEAQDVRLAQIRRRMSHQVLPADRWPLFEICADRLADERTRVHVSVDLLLADGASLALLMGEWGRLYRDPERPLPPLPPCTFRDCALADQALARGDRHRRSLAFWTARRPSSPTAPQLPLARRPEDLGLPRFVRRRAVLAADAWGRLKAEARRRRVTASVALCGAFAEILATWSGGAPFLLNLTTFRRAPLHPRIHEIVGDFTTMAFLAVDRGDDAPYVTFIKDLQAQLHAQLDHRVVHGVEVLREWSRSGPVSVPVVFTSMVRGDGTGAWNTAWLGEETFAISQTPHVWLDHQVLEQNGELVLRWDAVEALFPPGLLDAMFAAYLARVRALADEPGLWDSPRPELLPPAERAVQDAAHSRTRPHAAATLVDLFSARLAAQPAAPAVIAGDRTLTYAELGARASALARALRRRGAAPDTLVAIVMRRGWQQVVAAVAIALAGAAYLPIDASQPPGRCLQLIARGECSLALTQPDLEASFPWPADLLRLTVADAHDVDADDAPLVPPAPHHLAYVLFTSGSTGVPKGVMIEHRSAVNTIVDVNDRHRVLPTDRAIALSSLSFDLSVYDVFGTLAAGGAVVAPAQGEHADPTRWAALLARGVTVWNTVPALLHLLVEHAQGDARLAAAIQSLRLVMLSGDWIPVALPDALRRIVPHVTIIGQGGPTEATIWQAAYPIGQVDPGWPSVPYGRPLGDHVIHVHDPRGDRCPLWVPGELMIGGAGLARGYWRDEARTAESFFTHPRTGERLYRSGDFGRWLPDGNLEFLGRRDQQIKINGHRVELGEVEACIARHASVRACAVVATGERHARLVAHVVHDGPGDAWLIDQLLRRCRDQLPAYMVPAELRLHDALPLTPNGKVDRAALAALPSRPPPPPAAPPTTVDAALLATITREAAAAFDVADLDPATPFGELGMDSLIALALRGRLIRALGRELPTTLAYDHPSALAIARHLGGAATTPVDIPVTAADEPIAILGMACRLPGADTPEELWRVFAEGRDVTSDVPRARWDADAWYHPDPDHPGTTYCRRGGFVGDVTRFDAAFFAVAPREARGLDPQQRLLLEVAWETLERAGLRPEALQGREVGVYVGLSAYEYPWMEGHSLAEAMDGYAITGSTASTASGRLSYTLGLEGPAMTVDTACSSSLVAVHLACQALRDGACELALAGGASLLQTPQLFLEFSRLKGLAPDGRSKAFGAAADGVAWSEGCGLIILKRLSAARRDGDPILAVIRGDAVNQDGRSNGLTAPNGPAQERVIRRALARAGLAPADVDWVEAHGTGTRLGDPIEAQALGNVYGRERPTLDRPLWLGSSKSNMGHTLSAAGVAGLMKAVLALRHGEMPPTLFADPPTPHVDWQHSGLALLHRPRPWPHDPARPRRVGVSSFGVSGTNAHVVLEEAPPALNDKKFLPVPADSLATAASTGPAPVPATSPAPVPADSLATAASTGPAPVPATGPAPVPATSPAPDPADSHSSGSAASRAPVPPDSPAAPALTDSSSVHAPLLLSARTDEALRAQAARWAAWLADHPDTPWRDVLHTAGARRSVMRARAVVHVDGLAAALPALAALAADRPHPAVVRTGATGKLVAMFPGQGSQLAGMGRGLHHLPAFHDAFKNCTAALDAHLTRPLTSVWDDPAALAETAITQPALFALEVALYRQWQAWGLAPALLIGHSIGELAAAHVAGVLDLADAAALVCARGRLMQATRQGGAMAAIDAGEHEVAPLLGASVDIAGLAGPRQCVVSGDADAVDALVARFAALGRRTARLAVSHAFHSPHMDAMLADLRDAVARCRLAPPQIPIVSTLTGRVETDALCDPDYWVAQARRAVRFADAARAAFDAGARVFLECGPDAVLSAMCPACLPGEPPTTAIPSLRRRHPDADSLARARAALVVAGALEPGDLVPACGQLVALPTYAWQRALFWRDPPAPIAAGTRARYELGGSSRPLPDGGFLHELTVGTRAQPYLADHRIHGRIVAPGTFHLAVLLALAAERWPDQPVALEGVVFRAPLLLEDGVDLTLSALLRPHDDGFAVALATRGADGWHTHVEARLVRADEPPPAIPAADGPPDLVLGFDDLVALLAPMQVHWGPRWAFTAAIERRGDHVTTRLQAPPSAPGPAHAPVSPVLLDNASAAGLVHRWQSGAGDTPRLPFAVERLVWSGRPATIVEARRVRQDSFNFKDAGRDDAGEAETAALSLHDEHGACALAVPRMSLKRAPQDRFLRDHAGASLLTVTLEPVELPAAGAADVDVLEWHAPSDLAAVHDALHHVAGRVDAWLAGPDERPLVVLADGAPTARGALRGLLRSIRQEHPHRALRLVELPDPIPAPEEILIEGPDPTASRPVPEASPDLDARPVPETSPDLGARPVPEASPDLGARPVPSAIPDLGAEPVPSASPDLDARPVPSAIPDLGAEPAPDQRFLAPTLGASLLTAALACASEPELQLTSVGALAPRLRRVPDVAAAAPDLTAGTVLITGATGALGRLVAHHLVAHHGARRLVLASRRGPAAPDAAALVRSLRDAGAAHVDLIACDVADRPAVAAALALADAAADAPLVAVFHLAGVLADGLFTALDRPRLRAALRPKLDGAVHLDALTRRRRLAAFVLFSSAAGLLGSPGQSNYAAANAALDALAAARVAAGLPATSLVWGPWDAGMTTTLAAADLARMRRQGMTPLTAAQALALLDAALARREPVLAALHLDTRPRRDVPPLLAGLVPAIATTTGLRPQLAALPGPERLPHLEALARREIAGALGLAPDALPLDRPMRDLGLDSLMAVEVRNRLGERTRLALPATLVYDHPTPRAIAAFLLAQLGPLTAPPRPPTSAPVIAADDDAIAIVAMACRFPGGADSPEALWRLLVDGVDAITDVPAARFDIDAFYHPDPAHPGTTYARSGGFVGDLERFDAGFFRVPPLEAKSLDPQGRLLLECTWEALERAGIVPDSLAGSATGVYVGLCGSEYTATAMADARTIDAYALLGTTHAAVVGRLSYALGLRGPNFPVDTACSSSLVALHLACQGLRAGECDLALAGGANVLLSAEGFVYFSRLGALSPGGRCRTFSADADGYARGEGCGVLVLARLADARRRHLPVLAVIRGSAVNQDGRTQGFTAPSGPAQQDVLRRALAAARVPARSVGYVECHGTGTALGDPIEVQALAAVYGEGRDPADPVLVGSIKSNIGHTEGAAGVAGVIKAVLALQHRHVPPTLHVAALNPHVPWDSLPVAVARAGRPLAPGARVAVSAFSFSGTNAHVVLEPAPPDLSRAPADLPLAPADLAPPAPSDAGVAPDLSLAPADSPPAPRPHPLARTVPLLVSGRGPALAAQAARLAEALRADPGLALRDVAHTAAVHRTHFASRAAIAADDRAQALAALDALAAGRPHPALTRGLARERGAPVFVFSGQGGQWSGMGRELLALDVFAATVAACDAAFAGLVPPVRAFLAGEPSGPHDRPDVVQPALYALALGLAAVLAELGVRPAAVVGHSLGEVAAAVVAGALDLAAGARVVAHRSRRILELPHPGATAHVELPEAEALARIAGRPLDVAVVNGPRATVVAGEAGALAALLAELRAGSIFVRELPTGYAAHSRLLDPILPGFTAALADLRPTAAAVPFYSSVTGALTPGEALDALYWQDNLRRPVRLDRALARLLADGHTTFLELAPHPALLQSIAAAAPDAAVATALQRDRGDLGALLQALAGLHVHGLGLDWSRALAPLAGRRVALPTYAFQRERHWLPPRPTAAGATFDHPILHTHTDLADGRRLFTGRLAPGAQPWLADHVVLGGDLFPATGWLELAVTAARACAAPVVRRLELLAPLRVGPGPVLVQLTVDPPDPEGRRAVAISARPDRDGAPWTRHAVGALDRAGPEDHVPNDLSPSSSQGGDPVDLDALYREIARVGLEYGPSFRGLVEARRRGDRVFARLRLPASTPASGHAVHPALLDAALHVLGLTGVGTDASTALLPVVWSDVELTIVAPDELLARVDLEPAPDPDAPTLALTLATPDGRPVMRVGRLQFRRAALTNAAPPLHALTWRRLDAPPAAPGDPALDPPTVAPGVPILAVDPPTVVLGDPALAAALAAASFADLDAWLAALAAGAAPPARLVVVDPRRHLDLDGDPAAVVAAARRTAHAALRHARRWLAAPGLARCELVWLSRGAQGPAPRDPTGATAWGVLRVTRQEHPDRRVRLVDLGDAVDVPLLRRALALADEPELALHAGALWSPRITPTSPVHAAPRPAPHAGPLDPDHAVWISGASGALGRALARHLIAAHGVRRLLLTARRADPRLAAELEAQGAAVTMVEADAADPRAVDRALAALDRPLTAVFHLAGVLADALVGNLEAADLDRVLAPKLDGAWIAHARTRGQPLRAFVLFSSLSGWTGTEGQAAYAAANAALDALAAHRRALGLPATSLAWGLWDAGMAARLGADERAALRRRGVLPVAAAQALRWLDEALARREPHLVPALFDRALLGRRPHPLLRELAPPGRPAPRPAASRATDTLARVREALAAATGVDLAALAPDTLLRDLGLDSLMAVRLRGDLAEAFDVALPATLVYDHPTPAAIAAHLDRLVVPAAAPIAARAPDDEPLAIVGLACRLPAGVATPDELWRALVDGRDLIGPFPARWDTAAIYDPDPDVPGATYAREGGFFARPGDFDAAFFAISPREATMMDPQQRILLEATWEALEHAGIVPGELRERPAGVFVGGARIDYAPRIRLVDMDGYGGTGTAASVLSGRLAYTLGTTGPAVTVDTACSSSLVALQLAAAALRAGECELAIVAGVQAMVTPAMFVEFSRLRGLAPDGRCKPFAAEADGAGWSEGCGVLVLKRLTDARRDGDRVLALVRGVATGQDGRSQGLTAPNGPAQQRVIREALRRSGLAPADIDHVETHGTGTRLGDPIEAGALAGVFAATRPADRPLLLGAGKSNLGHTQAAAGALGVIKVVLSLTHEALPGILHADHPTPHVDWPTSGLALVRRTTPWPRGPRPRRAGVSSFGVSGTNAHVILEEAPREDKFKFSAIQPAPVPPDSPDAPRTAPAPSASPDAPRTAPGPAPDAAPAPSASPAARLHAPDFSASPDAPRAAPVPADSPAPPLPLLLSARTDDALRAQAARWRAWLADHPDAAWPDVLHTAAARRTHDVVRAAIAGPRLTALEALAELAADRPHAALTLARARPRGGLVFVFPGQGGQWPGMGRDLLIQSPVFAAAVDACDAALAPHTGWSVRAALRGDPDAPPLTRVDVVQPAIFALALGLAAVWRELGVTPVAVVGHSQGEIAAAVVAGALTLADGARVVAVRSRLVRGLAGGGAMLVVEHPQDDLLARLAAHGDDLALAAVNAPDSLVVSGRPAAVDRLAAELTELGAFCRRVDVDYASHCAAVDPILGDLAAALADLRPRPGELAFYSTVTGARVDGTALDAAYWCRNLRDPVRFDAAARQLLADGHDVLVEQSARPLLAVPLRKLADPAVVVAASLRRDVGGLAPIHEALGQLHAHGHAVDWRRLAPGAPLALPTYAFQHEHFWFEDPPPPSTGPHPLLGRGMTTSLRPGARLWPIALDLAAQPWLADHRVHNDAVLPGSGALELLLAAAADLCPGAPIVLRDLTLHRPVVLTPGQPWQGELVALRDGPGWTLRLSRRDGDEFIEHATAALETKDENFNNSVDLSRAPGEPVPSDLSRAPAGATTDLSRAPAEPVPSDLSRAPADVRRRCAVDVPRDQHLGALRRRGVTLGPAFQCAAELRRGPGEAWARLALPAALLPDARAYRAHPALVDAALGLTGLAAADDARPGMWLLARVRRVVAAAPLPREALALARVRVEDDRLDASVTVLDSSHAPALQLDGVEVVRVDAARPDPWFALEWRPAPAPEPTPSRGAWLLLGDLGPLTEPLTAALAARGHALRRAADLAAAPDDLHGVLFARTTRAHDPVDLTVDLADDRPTPRTVDLTVDPRIGSNAAHAVDLADDRPTPRTVDPRIGSNAAHADIERMTDDRPVDPDLDLLDADRRAADLSADLLDVLRALTSRAWPTQPRLVVLTRGAQAVAGSPVTDPAAAALWGLARSLTVEHAELACTRVDLDPAHTDDPELLARSLLADPADDELALRGEARLCARLARPAERDLPTRPAVVRPEAAYLVTGGLGGLGLLTASWLAELGARRLVLVGRGGVTTDEQRHALARLAAAGVAVDVHALDLTDLAAVRRLVAATPDLRGVFHLAGVLADGLLLNQTRAPLAAVLAPKLRGAVHLHLATAHLALDHFVLYSSVAALLDAPGLGAYAAANATLGALAHHRRARGLPALAIDWGLFSAAGMGRTADADGRARDRGLLSFTAERGRRLFARLLAADLPELGALDLDPARWLAHDPRARRRPRLAALLPDLPDAPGASDLAAALRDVPAAERRPRAIAWVREHAAGVLRLRPERLDDVRPLQELGIDSVMGLELRNRLGAAAGLTLPATLIWTHPTVAALADHLLGRVTPPAPPGPPAPAAGDDLLAAFDAELRELDALLHTT